MKMRMIIATSALVVLAACGSDDEPKTSPTSESAPSSAPSSAPTTDATSAAPEDASPKSAADLVGTWEDPKARWTVRFKDDGTYEMDYEGVKDFMSGRYSLNGSAVSLSNDEGTDRGTVKGSSLVFKLGTLTRK